jgi:hypothetical protein
MRYRGADVGCEVCDLRTHRCKGTDGPSCWPWRLARAPYSLAPAAAHKLPKTREEISKPLAHLQGSQICSASTGDTTQRGHECEARLVSRVSQLRLSWSNSSLLACSDYLFKLVLIGDSGVGKSCLLLRFAVRVHAFRPAHTHLLR